LLLLLALVGCAVAQMTFPVIVGSDAGTPNGNTIYEPTLPGWYMNAFFPNNITLNVGDTINFKWGTAMEHSVTNDPLHTCANPENCALPKGNPNNFTGQMINSGIVPEVLAYPYGYNVTFMMTGMFTFGCIIHPYQTILINVNAAGSTYINTPASVATAGAASIAALIAMVPSWNTAAAAAQIPKYTLMGTNKYYWVQGGFDLPQYQTVSLRYYPFNLSINTGDTVVFTSSYLEPHATAFNGSQWVDVDYPNAIYNTPMDGGNPVPVNSLNQAAVTYYDGSTLISSSLIFNPGNPGLAGIPGSIVMWNITFTKAGMYPYLCALHDDFGMGGVVHVSGPTIFPSSSGTSTGSTSSSGGSGGASALAPSAFLFALSFLLYIFNN